MRKDLEDLAERLGTEMSQTTPEEMPERTSDRIRNNKKKLQVNSVCFDFRESIRLEHSSFEEKAHGTHAPYS